MSGCKYSKLSNYRLWVLIVFGFLFLLLLYFGFKTKIFSLIFLSAAAAMVIIFGAVKKAPEFFILATTTFICLAIVEFALATLKPAAGIYDVKNNHGKRSYFTKSDLGYQPFPGVFTARKKASAENIIYDAKYSIGADGFRNTPNNPEKWEARINLFGGSFTFGEGLNDDETLSYYLAEELPGIYVKNYGFHGYGPHHAIAILQSGRDTSGAVNVLLTFLEHALRSGCVPNYSDGTPRYLLIDGERPIRKGVCKKTALEMALNYSNIYNMVWPILFRSRIAENKRLYEALLVEFIRISRARGQVPVIGFVDEVPPTRVANKTLLDKIRATNFNVLDLTLLDNDGMLEAKFYLHELDRHPSAVANLNRAKILSQWIRDNVPLPVNEKHEMASPD